MRERTDSLWTVVNNVFVKSCVFVNDKYDPNYPIPIYPDLKKVKFWGNYYRPNLEYLE